MKSVQIKQLDLKMQALERPKLAPNLHDRTSGLIAQMFESLVENRVRYCLWKGNSHLDQSLQGEGDLDILVERNDIGKFTAVLSNLGFKKAIPPRNHELPAVWNFYGFDPNGRGFVNVHVHYQLVLGHELTNNYRLPVERDILANAERRAGVFITAPETELILFVIRAVLNNSVAESMMRWLAGISGQHDQKFARKFGYLDSVAEKGRLKEILDEQFPMLNQEIFEVCLKSLRDGETNLGKMNARRKLKKALKDFSRTSSPFEFVRRTKRGLARIGRKVFRFQPPRKKFEGGGMIMAIVGGDGAGKTTCVNEISRWLSEKFVVRTVHFGKPPKSGLTIVVGGVLRLYKKATGAPRSSSSDPGFLECLRMFCIARDRHKLQKGMRRNAANGEIVISDRYPIPNLNLMDAPRIPAKTRGRLSDRELRYYQEILPPERLFVLRVEPKVAVARKLDEPAEHVFTRSTELWNFDWKGSNAHVIDANQPLRKVLNEFKSSVWETL
jgi:thymidylate kinase